MRVSARVYDVKGGAIFSKNRFFGTTHGDAWSPRLRSPSVIMAPVYIDDRKLRLKHFTSTMTRAFSLKDSTSQFHPLTEFQTEPFLEQISLPPKISATEKT